MPYDHPNDMLTSFEGLKYERYLFKPVDNCETAGCHADIYLPPNTSGPCPVAISIHGGGWTTGDTHHIFVGHFKYLMDRGFAVASVEYRMAPHASLDDMREDWVDAYRWVRNKLPAITNGRTDADRIFVFGGSAGGTATLWLGLDAAAAGLPPPKALYSVYPAVVWERVDLPADGQTNGVHTFDQDVRALPEDKQKLLKELYDGPVCTAHDLKNEHKKPLTGRRVWFDLIINGHAPELISTVLRSKYPYPEKYDWLKQVTSDYPPTVFVKALADEMLDPNQTQIAYEKLRDLGVETKLIEAKDMKHGDVEGEHDIKSHPPREKYFWEKVYPPALDWCIERTQGPKG